MRYNLRLNFWFNGNKILTTSGGGMVLSSNAMAIEKMRFWSTQAREQVIWYEHKEFGYNYRMSNVCAAIGRGQLDFLPEKLRIRKSIHKAYKKAVEGLPAHIKLTAEKGASNYWLNLLVIDSDTVTPSQIVTTLQNAQIESRPAWKPMHMQPLFKDALFITAEDVFGEGADCVGTGKSVDEDIFERTVCLPSGDALTEQQIGEVIAEMKDCFGKSRESDLRAIAQVTTM